MQRSQRFMDSGILSLIKIWVVLGLQTACFFVELLLRGTQDDCTFSFYLFRLTLYSYNVMLVLLGLDLGKSFAHKNLQEFPFKLSFLVERKNNL